MNKLILLSMVAVIMVTVGCNKKHENETSMDANAVVSENVVSVSESTNMVDPNAVPVVVENAASAVSEVVEDVTAMTNEKPTPKNIQKALKNAGLYSGKLDGSIGPKTKKAIEAFQSQNGLKADGKVGPRTWKALSAYLNKSTEVVNPTEAEQAVPAGQ